MRLVVELADGGRIARAVRTKGLGYAETVEVDAVQVTVTVTDDQGQYASAIPRTAFRVFEDDRPQAVGNFTSEDVPLDLVVAVDISGSMTSVMPKVKTAVKEFLRAVPSRNASRYSASTTTSLPSREGRPIQRSAGGPSIVLRRGAQPLFTMSLSAGSACWDARPAGGRSSCSRTERIRGAM